MDRDPVAGPLRQELGGYREYAPPPQLASIAEAVWVHRTPRDVRLDGDAMHRVLPDPSLSLALYCHRDANGRVIDPRLIVIGPIRTPRQFTLRAGFEIAAVKLKLEWVVPVLGLDPADHEDGQDDLSLVLPRTAESLLGVISETRTAEDAAGVLAGTVVRQSRREPRSRPEVTARALDLVRRTAGRLPVEIVADRMGMSIRHLRRTVRRDAGVSLKSYARTLRLLHAMTTADRAADPAWARLAADAGYYDQSHLVRECRALCGLPPERLFRERRAEAEISNRG